MTETEITLIRITELSREYISLKTFMEAAGLDAAEYEIYIKGININNVNDVKVKKGDLLWLYPKIT